MSKIFEAGKFVGQVAKEAVGINFIQTYNRIHPEPDTMRRYIRNAYLSFSKILIPETTASYERLLRSLIDDLEPVSAIVAADLLTGIGVDIAAITLPGSVIIPRPLPEYTLGEQAQVVFGSKLVYNLLIATFNVIGRNRYEKSRRNRN